MCVCVCVCRYVYMTCTHTPVTYKCCIPVSMYVCTIHMHAYVNISVCSGIISFVLLFSSGADITCRPPPPTPECLVFCWHPCWEFTASLNAAMHTQSTVDSSEGLNLCCRCKTSTVQNRQQQPTESLSPKYMRKRSDRNHLHPVRQIPDPIAQHPEQSGNFTGVGVVRACWVWCFRGFGFMSRSIHWRSWRPPATTRRLAPVPT